MTTSIKNYATGAVESVHYARLDSVTEEYPAGSTGTIAAGADQAMLTHKALATFSDTPATAEDVPIEGDAGNLGTMFSRSLENATGTITFNSIDHTYQSVAENLLIYSDGDYEKMGIDDACTVLNPMCLIINSHATSLEAASLDEKGWEVREIWRTTSEKTEDSQSGTEFTAQPQGHNLVFSHAAQDLQGVAVSLVNYNRTKLRGQRYWSEHQRIAHTFIGDAAETTVTLTKTPAAEDGAKVTVSIDGVAKAYTTDYTVSGLVVTFVVAPGASAVVVIVYEYEADC